MTDLPPEKIVFTNGCFDILHPGHVDLLRAARSLGTKLIVGLNSDHSVRNLKGASRPILDQESRAEILRAIKFVDEVIIFDENTPENLIRQINPDVLVKGGDWKLTEIVGAKHVTERGGEVHLIPFLRQQSTSRIVEKIEKSKTEQLPDNSKSAEETTLRQFVSERLSVRRSLLETHTENIIRIVEEIRAADTKLSIFFTETSERSVREAVQRLEKAFSQIDPTAEGLTGKHQKKIDLALIFDDARLIADDSSLTEKLMNLRHKNVRTILIGNYLSKKSLALADISLNVGVEQDYIFKEFITTIVNVVVECKQDKSGI